MFGVEIVEERVVMDRNRITGGGVTAGIDFGLTLIALVGGEDDAKLAQLTLEYDPQPPYRSGSPATADEHILEEARKKTEAQFELRKKIIAELLR